MSESETNTDNANTPKPRGRPPKPKTLVIKNTRPCLITLPAVKAENGADLFPSKMLLPGESNVDPAYWEAVKGKEALKIWIAAGYLQDLGPGEAKRLDKGLDVLPSDKAAEQIARNNSIQMLDEWRAKTKIPDYVKLIDDRKRALVANA